MQMWGVSAEQAREPVNEAAALLSLLERGDPRVCEFLELLKASTCLDSTDSYPQKDSVVHAADSMSSAASTCHLVEAIDASLRVASLNIRGQMASGLQDLHNLAKNNDLDIITIQETLHPSHVQLPGYFWLPRNPTTG
jgi:hypothetical protein